MATGRVVRLVREKGFGFLQGSDGREYFFHRSAAGADFDDLTDGQAVEFEEERSDKGPRAARVRADFSG